MVSSFESTELSGSFFFGAYKRVARSWNRLSRLQRSVFLTILSGLMFFWLCYTSLQATRDVGGGHKLSHLEQLIRNNVPKRPEEGSMPINPKIQSDKGPRNRIEAVREALEKAKGNPKDLDFDADHVVDKNEDNALENDFNDDDEEAKNVNGGSNQAEETFADDDDFLPAKDGSLKFKGPTNKRQEAVVESFKHAWNNYRLYAWGQDHLNPISKSGNNWFGLGLTLIDSLDTMYIMGLNDEFDEAKGWVRDKLDFNINKDVNLFETTIRVLGGLLSAYHLSTDTVFLTKAEDLGNRLLGAFKTSSGIPFSDVNLLNARGHAPKWSPDSSTSEVTTIQLEFKDLSRSTKDGKFEAAADRISKKVHELEKTQGLVPIFIKPNTGKFRKGATITLGARGDSYYEYLLKQWIQTGKTTNYLKMDFLESVQGVANTLAKRTVPNKLLFVGELLSGSFSPKMDELVCFLPGTLALASHHGLKVSGKLPPTSEADDGEIQEDILLQMAEELAYTCYLTFARQPTFLAPEITFFNTEDSTGSTKDDFYVKPNDAHYLLRPETIESLWYLYYVTGNKTYQDWGWNIYQGIEKYTRVAHGYTTIGNVRNGMDLRPRDMMESFFLGETLKYLYLLFSDEKEINLKRWVFNTEAHPLPVYPD